MGVENLQPREVKLPPYDWEYFLHPATAAKVNALLDVVHMLKLLRNLLGEEKALHLGDEVISWRCIQVGISVVEGKQVVEY